MERDDALSVVTDEILRMDEQVVHPWESFDLPGENRMVVDHGSGIYVQDSNGNRLLDAPAGMWCVNVGHGRREIIDAIVQQLSRLSYTSPWSHPTEPAARLADRLGHLSPGDLNHVFYTTGGSTAVDSALRFVGFYNNVRGRPEKKHILSRHDAYHGSTYLAASVSGKTRDRSWFDFETSQIRSEAARARYNLAQQQLILDVAEGYFNVLRAADALTTAQATETAIGRQYEQAQERFDVGLIAITEVYEARASYDDSKSRRIAAESDLDIAREDLARLTGEYTEQLDNLRQEFPLARPAPANPTEWEKIALGQNWEIQTALLELDASKSTLESRKAGHYPTLDLNASYGETDINGLGPGGTGSTAGSGGATRSGNGTTTEGVISLTLNVPLYLGGGTQAGVRQQRSLVTVADQALNTVRRDVRVNTRSLFRQVNTNIESASALEQTIISRRSALDATRAG